MGLRNIGEAHSLGPDVPLRLRALQTLRLLYQQLLIMTKSGFAAKTRRGRRLDVNAQKRTVVREKGDGW